MGHWAENLDRHNGQPSQKGRGSPTISTDRIDSVSFPHHFTEEMAARNTTTIIVHNLPPTATEEFLRKLFGQDGNEGKVEQVILKSKTRRNGQQAHYAFITFDSIPARQRAIADMNYTKLDNHAILVVPCDVGTKKRIGSHEGNLFVKNIDPSIDEAPLHDAFSNFGDVISVHIRRDAAGKSLGFGFIQFARPEDAESAMNDLEGASINNRPIEIRRYMKPFQSPEATFKNVHVKSASGSLPDGLNTDDGLRDFMSQFGEVQSAVVKISPTVAEVARPAGCFGLCNFEDHDCAKRAVEELDGQTFGDCIIRCSRCKSHHERMEEIQKSTQLFKRELYTRYHGRNLYVRGFDETMTEDELRDMFSEFGQIENVKIKRDSEGNSKKFGFVCYVTEESARNCLHRSTLMRANGKQIYVAVHISSDRLRQMAVAQHLQDRGQAQARAAAPPPAPPVPLMPQIPPFPAFVQTYPQHPSLAVGAGLGLGVPLMPGTTAKQRLRQEVLEQFADGYARSEMLGRIRDMSEAQAAHLGKDQDLLSRWLAQS
jgi:polyadenylate-binding protein